jgi:hypothetical protein
MLSHPARHAAPATLALVAAVVIALLGGCATATPVPTAPAATAATDTTAPTVSPTPPASPTPTPTPTPSSAALLTLAPTDAGRTLAAGTYRVDGFAVPVSLTLPGGWLTNGFMPNDLVLRNDKAFLALVVMDSVYPNPCHTEVNPKRVKAGVDALVAAFSGMRGFRVRDLRGATVGGATGKSFTLWNSIDLQQQHCSDPNIVWIGRDRDGAPVLETAPSADLLWVVDVAGTTVLIGGPAEIVNAITFGPAGG